MKLTIAQFTSSLQLAGQERVAVDLAKAFHAQGHISMVCTMVTGGELVQELDAAGIPFHCFHAKGGCDVRSILSVIRYIRKFNVDAVITHGNFRLVPRVAAILSNVPAFIHVEHNVSHTKAYMQILLNRLLTLFTDKIVCISRSSQASLLEIERTDPSKVVVIPNGLSTDRFGHEKDTTVARDGTLRVGIVGRFSEQKGHTYFVDAAAIIVRAYKNVEFVFVGDGELRPMIEERVHSCDIESYCRFIGVRNDVPSLLKTFDVFVLSSLWEGLPISLLESQYFGVASVVTDVGGNPEVIKDSCNGLLVPARDPDALAGAILRLLTDDVLRRDLGKRGNEVFHSKYSVDSMATSYLDVIKEIISSKRNRTQGRADCAAD